MSGEIGLHDDSMTAHLEAGLQVQDEGLEIKAVDAVVQQHVHGLEGGLAQLQAVVDLVLEGAQVHDADEGLVDDGLCVHARHDAR